MYEESTQHQLLLASDVLGIVVLTDETLIAIDSSYQRNRECVKRKWHCLRCLAKSAFYKEDIITVLHASTFTMTLLYVDFDQAVRLGCRHSHKKELFA